MSLKIASGEWEFTKFPNVGFFKRYKMVRLVMNWLLYITLQQIFLLIKRIK